jgi:peptide-methionine (S)-S-oxide reductase
MSDRSVLKCWTAMALLSAALLGAAPAAKRAAASPAAPPGPDRAEAAFAMGCFWCAEATFEGIPGVISVTSGYCGGEEKNPTYEQVSAGRTGHRESIDVLYDPKRITYARLLEIFWHNVDPTQADGQFCDRGAQYRSAIFYRGEEQRRLAEESRKKLVASRRFRKPIVTDLLAFKSFWPAEEYHQDYYKKNPVEYHAYRLGCGRDQRLRELWGAAPAAH